MLQAMPSMDQAMPGMDGPGVAEQGPQPPGRQSGQEVQAVMLHNGLMVTAVPTGPDLISLAGHSGPAPAALLDPSGMKREVMHDPPRNDLLIASSEP